MALRILIVEDDKHIRRILESLLDARAVAGRARPRGRVGAGRQGGARTRSTMGPTTWSSAICSCRAWTASPSRRELRKHQHGADVPLIVTSAIYKDAGDDRAAAVGDRRPVLRQAVPDQRDPRRCQEAARRRPDRRRDPRRAPWRDADAASKRSSPQPTVGSLAERAAAAHPARAVGEADHRHAGPPARQGQKGDRARCTAPRSPLPPTCAPRRSATSWSRAASSTRRAIARRSHARRMRRSGSASRSSSWAASATRSC